MNISALLKQGGHADLSCAAQLPPLKPRGRLLLPRGLAFAQPGRDSQPGSPLTSGACVSWRSHGSGCGQQDKGGTAAGVVYSPSSPMPRPGNHRDEACAATYEACAATYAERGYVSEGIAGLRPTPPA